MQKQNEKTGRPWKLLVFAGQRPRSESADRFLRDSGLRFHYLHTQIWGDPPGRTGCSSPYPQLNYVPCADVLQWRRNQRRQRDQRRRHQAHAALTLFFVTLLLCGGCTRPPHQNWAQYYADARHKRDIHDKTAAEMAERGFRETASLDPLLHYKFLLLKADIASCIEPHAALTQLDVVSPELTKHADL